MSSPQNVFSSYASDSHLPDAKPEEEEASLPAVTTATTSSSSATSDLGVFAAVATSEKVI